MNQPGTADTGGRESSTAGAKEKIAGGLDRAANRLRQNVESMPAEGRGRQALEKVAGGVQSTADYVRGIDMSTLGEDTRAYIREKPTNALAIAAIGGFLLGLLMSRR